MSTGNRFLLTDYIRRYNEKNIDGMLGLFTDDVVFESISSATGYISVKGKENLRRLAEKSAEIFSERRQTLTTMVLDENNIAVEVDYWARLAMDLPDGKKAGEEVQFRGASFFVVRDGRISRLTDYM
jgi:ketosteroid isomerase-like protein